MNLLFHCELRKETDIMNEEFKETIGKMSDLCTVSANEIGNALKSVSGQIDSKPILAFTDFDRCDGIVWETSKGTIVTIQGSINPQANLSIQDINTGEEVADIDWRNVLMDILPINR